MTGDEGTFEVRWLPCSSKVIPLLNLTSAMRLAWNTLHAGQLQSRSFFRVRSLACLLFTFDEFGCDPGVDLFTFDPIYGQGWERMLSNGGLPYTHRLAPPISTLSP